MAKKHTPEKNLSFLEKYNYLFFEVLIVLCFVALAIAYWWPVRLLPYFGDNTTLVINGTKILQERNYQPLILSEFSISHPTLFLVFTGIIWDIFGDSLTTSHALMIPWFVLLLWSFFRLLKKKLPLYITIVSTFSFAFLPIVINQFELITIHLVVASLTTTAVMFWFEDKRVHSMIVAALAILTSWVGLLILPAIFADWLLGSREDKQPPRYFLIPLGAFVLWFLYHGISAGWWFVAPGFSTTIPQNVAIFFSYTLFVAKTILFTSVHWLYFIPGLLLVTWSFFSSYKNKTFPRFDFFTLVTFASSILYFGFLGSFSVEKALFLLPLLLITTLQAFSKLINDLFGENQLWLVAVVITFLGFISITQWRVNKNQGPGFHFKPDFNLAFQDTIYAHMQANLYLETNYSDAEIVGGFPEISQLTEPHNGYVKTPLNFSFCKDYQPKVSMKQILYIHPYHVSQIDCYRIVEDLQPELLKNFSHNGKWIQLYSLTAASNSATASEKETQQ